MKALDEEDSETFNPSEMIMQMMKSMDQILSAESVTMADSFFILNMIDFCD